MTKNLITRKIQFLFLIGAILLAPFIARASAVTASVDSLQNLLQNDTDARQRAIIYIHLADIHVDSLNISSQYWDKALTEAAKAKDEYMMKYGDYNFTFVITPILSDNYRGSYKKINL